MATARDFAAEREPSDLIGPDQLTGDMSGDDIAFVLRGIRFGQGLMRSRWTSRPAIICSIACSLGSGTRGEGSPLPAALVGRGIGRLFVVTESENLNL